MPRPILRPSGSPRSARSAHSARSPLPHRTPLALVSLGLAGAVLATGLVGCRSRAFNTQVKDTPAAAKPGAPLTACMSLQGNGDRFMATLGQVTALLERNVEPLLVQGGSSGSLTSVIVRGVLANEKLKASTASPDGRSLSHAQRSSIILATMIGPAETFLFLPSLNRLGKVIASLANYQLAARFADAFIGLPEQELAHVEAVTSQGVLLADFVMHTDFDDVLREPDFKKRTAMTMDKWIKFADLKLVTPRRFIEALLSPPPKAGAAPTAEQAENEMLKERYFELYRNEDMRPESRRAKKRDDDPAESLQAYNRLLSSVGAAAGLIPADRLEELFLKAIKAIENVPFIGGFAATASKPFYMPSHTKLWNAYNGKSFDGRPLPLPAGTVLHTTARKAKKRLLGTGLIEKTGIEGFYMVYYPSPDVFAGIEKLHSSLPPNESFLQYPTASGNEIVLPKQNLLVLGPDKSMALEVKTSIAEPGAMRRDPIPLDAAELARTGLTFAEDETIVSYGGWLDHLSPATFMRYPSCAGVDYSVYMVSRNEGLRVFQRQAIRAVIDGSPAAFKTAFDADKDKPDTPVGRFMTSLERYMDHSEQIKGTRGKVRLDFDWDNPSAPRGAGAKDPAEAQRLKEFTKVLLNNRAGLFIRAYQHASKNIDAVIPRATESTGPLAALSSVDIDGLPRSADIAPAVEGITGTLVPKN